VRSPRLSEAEERDIEECLKAIREGRCYVFKSVEEAIKWLRSDDSEEKQESGCEHEWVFERWVETTASTEVYCVYKCRKCGLRWIVKPEYVSNSYSTSGMVPYGGDCSSEVPRMRL